MCGIFGILSNKKINTSHLAILANESKRRGRDSSGVIFFQDSKYMTHKADHNVDKLLSSIKFNSPSLALGHSRLITNGLADNQPVIRNNNIAVLHNGIVVNDSEVWNELGTKRHYEIDTEVIAAIAEKTIDEGQDISIIAKNVLAKCQGVIACAMIVPAKGKALLFSNNGSLYVGTIDGATHFASERFSLERIGCHNIEQVKDEAVIIDIPVSHEDIEVKEVKSRKENLIPSLLLSSSAEKLLEHHTPNLRRCTRCILPETMPFISFDEQGVCNYCKNYKLRNVPKPKEELFKIVEPYRRTKGHDCIVPFSGGRDSCYGLHLIMKELKMKPVTYTYDWGMVTDLGRRNISRMCAELGVENIIVAADISKKRQNIAKNLTAWLKSPHLGMISILTAGDKHFFRYVEDVKKQTGISLNLWGVNPLEVTHFKAGFLGIKPDFEEKKVYSNGALKQLRYQSLRFKAMLESPGYFNASLWDTLSGEYFRSFTKKEDYFHIFDYWRWEEDTIDKTLAEYGWELAPDTKTTWRIGDGTAAFYNYIYYTVAGFTEHDTFRSNQIREGQITREKALELVMDENQPRYANIKWYLDVLGIDFQQTISIINKIPKLYKID